MVPSAEASSHRKAVYNPKTVILHAASLRQAFAHCGRFLTAATRRCLDSVSVPMRRVMLSHPLLVVALVSFYLTNKLMEHRLFLNRRNFQWECHKTPHLYRVLAHVSMGCSRVQGKLPMRYSPVCHFRSRCKHRH